METPLSGLGVSAYCYKKLIEKREIDQFGAVMRAKADGFAAIEFPRLILPQGETKQSCAAGLKRLCDSEGLSILCHAVPADFLNNSDGDWRSEVERLREDLDIAAELGVSLMRHDVSRGFPAEFLGPRGFSDALPVLRDACCAVTERAAEMGIATVVENHGRFFQDSYRVEALINAVDHENFGLLMDVGNFLCTDEDPAEAVGRLVGYAKHVHFKDFHMKSGMMPDPGPGWIQSRAKNYLKGTIIGHGDVPTLQCIRILKAADYSGTIAIEFEGMEDPDKATVIGRENLRRYWEAVA